MTALEEMDENGIIKETSLDTRFHAGSIEDDRDEKWKHLIKLSDSKEQLNTTGFSANTDMDNLDYVQTTSTFKTPQKGTPLHSTPIKRNVDSPVIKHEEAQRYSEIPGIHSTPVKLDPSTHEYAVPNITPKASTSSSMNSLDDSENTEPVLEPLNDNVFYPPQNISVRVRPLLNEGHHPRRPVQEVSPQQASDRLSRPFSRKEAAWKEEEELGMGYMPVTVLYNENSDDVLI